MRLMELFVAVTILLSLAGISYMVWYEHENPCVEYGEEHCFYQYQFEQLTYHCARQCLRRQDGTRD